LKNIENKWVSEVFTYCCEFPIILVGCNKDLRNDPNIIEELRKVHQKPVTYKEGKKVAVRIGAIKYLECALSDRDSVNEVLEWATRAALIFKHKKS